MKPANNPRSRISSHASIPEPSPHHSKFIGTLASIFKPNVYLELGVYTGDTVKEVLNYANTVHGVDIVERQELKNIKASSSKVQFYYTTTDEFFKSFTQKVDMIFIDANHNSVFSMRDFENSLKLLNDGGMIIMHDTDPEDNRLFDGGYCGCSYKIVPILEKRDDINIVTFPLQEAGLSIITRKNDTRTYRRCTMTESDREKYYD